MKKILISIISFLLIFSLVTVVDAQDATSSSETIREKVQEKVKKDGYCLVILFK